eukprot:766608-Hanusia_phi.AAC.3
MKTLVPKEEGKVLAVAEGSGQHVSSFAKEFPHLKFVATDLGSKAIASIRAYVQEEGVSNVVAMEQLDMTADNRWEDKSWAGPASFDLVYAVNLTHISPWAASLGLLATAARLLREGGVLMVYGPFKVDGKCTREEKRGGGEEKRGGEEGRRSGEEKRRGRRGEKEKRRRREEKRRRGEEKRGGERRSGEGRRKWRRRGKERRGDEEKELEMTCLQTESNEAFDQKLRSQNSEWGEKAILFASSPPPALLPLSVPPFPSPFLSSAQLSSAQLCSRFRCTPLLTSPLLTSPHLTTSQGIETSMISKQLERNEVV